MIFRQLFDHDSSTYTYLIADNTQRIAALIDPVITHTDSYLNLVSDLNLTLKYAIDTHVHADHISALGALNDACGCITLVGNAGEVSCASEALADGRTIEVGDLRLQCLSTPGHTDSSYCFYLEHPQPMVFTGDTLLIRGCGRTDFQAGNAKDLYHSIHQKLYTLPSHTQVWPGHDYKGWTQSSIDEEQRLNPRTQLPEHEFVTFMDNLNLPDPKLMDIAVPTNLQCGRSVT